MIEKIKGSILNMESKNNRIYFFVQDTRGNAKASIKYLYDMALTLKNNGHNVIVLHEKKEYTPVNSWLNGDYDSIPHQCLEGANLAISPEDTLIIPEIFGFIMEQVKNLPCGKIVLCQAYDHIFETLSPGATWQQFGFFKCITTSELQKEHISRIMKNVSIDVIEPFISDTFEKQTLPPKTIIGISSREQREALNIIKEFYAKYPQFRFFTFKDLRGMSYEEFANSVRECFLGVWVDQTSAFGTFPLESMKCGVPVIGKIPNTEPDWLGENGMWTYDANKIVEILGTYVLAWLEGVELTDEVKDKMKETLQNWLNPEAAEETSVVEEEEEEETSTPGNDLPWKDDEETSKPSKNNYELKAPVKKSKADKFDALFEDEN